MTKTLILAIDYGLFEEMIEDYIDNNGLLAENEKIILIDLPVSLNSDGKVEVEITYTEPSDGW